MPPFEIPRTAGAWRPGTPGGPSGDKPSVVVTYRRKRHSVPPARRVRTCRRIEVATCPGAGEADPAAPDPRATMVAPPRRLPAWASRGSKVVDSALWSTRVPPAHTLCHGLNCCVSRPAVARAMKAARTPRALDLGQARAASASGGLLAATLRGSGGHFLLELETRKGTALLVSSNSTQPRRFRNPLLALQLVREELGLHSARYVLGDWSAPAAKVERPRRPDRVNAFRLASRSGPLS